MSLVRWLRFKYCRLFGHDVLRVNHWGGHRSWICIRCQTSVVPNNYHDDPEPKLGGPTGHSLLDALEDINRTLRKHKLK